MQALADKVLGKLHFTLEQVQDLTPTPMTLSSVMFYTGTNPYTGEEVYVARSQEDKRRQKSYFFGGELPKDRLHVPNVKSSPRAPKTRRGLATSGGSKRSDKRRTGAKHR